MRDEERSKAVLSRREFVRRVGAATLAGGAGLSFPLACVRSPSLLEPPVRAPLRFPPVLRPEGETLLAAPAAIDVGGARSAAVWAYNGVVPGPTIRARSGESIRVHLQNALPQDTTIHWHGLIVPHDMDGSPHRAVPGGSGTDYHFPVVQRAGTYWYHPHPHMHTGEQVARGLAGFLLVTDDEEAALHLPSGEYELPLLIRDATMERGVIFRS